MTPGDSPRMPHPEVQPTMTVAEAGAWLGMNRSSSYEAAKRGDIPTLKVNGRMRVPTATFRRKFGLDQAPGAEVAS